MTPPWVWGVDPGVKNIGVTLLYPNGKPAHVIDVRIKGRGKRARRVLTQWIPDPTNPMAMVVMGETTLPPGADPLPYVIDAIHDVPRKDNERAVVELVGGPVARQLMIVSGIIQGVLWVRTGHRPVEVAANTWRKAVLGIPGRTTAAGAERLATQWASVGCWPESSSGHAAESRFIASYGQSSIFCLR